MSNTTPVTIAQWRACYQNDQLKPADLLIPMLESLDQNDPVWITVTGSDALTKRLQELEQLRQKHSLAELPLYGVPFAAKDNIDTAALPTSCACPAFTYQAEQSATAIRLLEAAGAVLIGKTNLDQFATGLVGVRSPFGAVPNPFNADYISGGSSSGSAVAVSRALVPFALGTDTAGSGRVPAAFTNTVGLKPTRGAISTSGVVPACRSLDCVSIFALNVEDAEQVYRLLAAFDDDDIYSRNAPAAVHATLPERPTLGIPAETPWFGDKQAEALWHRNLEQMATLADLVTIDTTVFRQAAELLYHGPWLAERYHITEKLMLEQPQQLLPVIQEILKNAPSITALSAFRAQYRLAELKRQADAVLETVDALLLPSTPGIYTQADVAANPIELNSQLGAWTNFVNLLDYCALALPGGFRNDGLPGGITLVAPAWHDLALAEFGKRWQTGFTWQAGATGNTLPPTNPGSTAVPADGYISLAVVGAHLSGMPLNGQLTERGAVLLRSTRTAACYHLYALANTTPPKPGLVRAADGESIAIEIWQMPLSQFGSFVDLVPAPLGIGNIETVNGQWVKGFICEPLAIDSATDITHLRGWRAYIAQQGNDNCNKENTHAD